MIVAFATLVSLKAVKLRNTSAPKNTPPSAQILSARQDGRRPVSAKITA